MTQGVRFSTLNKQEKFTSPPKIFATVKVVNINAIREKKLKLFFPMSDCISDYISYYL